MSAHPPLRTSDLAGVVYSSGKVFDGLRTGRLDTEAFLRSGETDGIASRADLSLLEDLRDAVQLVIAFRDSGDQPDRPAQVLDGDFVRAVNRTLRRSAALRPGELRRDDQRIGVHTRYGPHSPPALTADGLDALVAECVGGKDAQADALELFVRLAAAQPFEDGNKRTALFAANALLLTAGTRTVLQVPVDENDPAVADRFNDLLARAYVLGEREPVKEYMAQRGLAALTKAPPAPEARVPIAPSARAAEMRRQISARAADIDDAPDATVEESQGLR